MKRNASYYLSSPYSSNTRRRLSFGGSYSSGKSSSGFSLAYEDQASGFLSTSLTGGTSSKTGGFVSTVLKNQKGGDNFNKKGTTQVIERAGLIDGGISTTTSGNTVAVGHCTMPSGSVFASIWRAIVKQLVLRIGVGDVSEVSAALPTVSITCNVAVEYRVDAQASVSTMNHTLSATSSIDSIAFYFFTQFNNLVADLQNLEILAITYTPGTSKLRLYRMNLVNAKVAISSKSTLKIQNRTTNGTNDEEAVDNVPLHGKAYFGRGTGAKPLTRDASYGIASTGFYGDDSYGCMAKVPTEVWYQEPVPASHFQNVTRFGKVLIEPGHIKTSVLTDYVVIKLDSVFRELISKGMTSTKHSKTAIGSYRFCLLEKILNPTTPSSANSIKVAYEHNIRIGSYLMVSSNTMTAQMNGVGTFANEA